MVLLRSFIATALTALVVSAQGTDSYTETKTGVTYQRFLKGQYSFGITAPSSIDSDEFTAQLTGPVVGWSGVSLAGQMKGSLLITAWANGKNVVTGFRYVDGYTIPFVYNLTGPTLTQIPCGTFVNATHFTVTFLCQKCNTWTSLKGLEAGFPLTNDVSIFGYAASNAPVTNPADPGSGFSIHTSFGQYAAQLGKARSEQYSGQEVCGGTGGGGSSTKEPEVSTRTPVVSTKTNSSKTTAAATTTREVESTKAASPAGPAGESSAETSKLPVKTSIAVTSMLKPTIVRPTFAQSTKAPTTKSTTAKPTIVQPTTAKPKKTSTPSLIIDPPPLSETQTPIIVVPEPTRTAIEEPTRPTKATTIKPAVPTNIVGGTAPKARHWQQCGGITYKGPTKCTWPWRCKKMNEYYSQCV